MDIKKQVELFKTLPYATQKTKVLEMLRQLQGVYDIFDMFYKIISTIDKISDVVILYLYQSILEIADEIQEGNQEQAQDKIKKMTETLMMIRKQEEMEREREGNLDDMLRSS